MWSCPLRACRRTGRSWLCGWKHDGIFERRGQSRLSYDRFKRRRAIFACRYKIRGHILVSEMDSYAGTTVWVSHYKFMQHFSRYQIFATIFPLLSCRAQNMFFNTMRVVEGWFGVELKEILCKFAENQAWIGFCRALSRTNIAGKEHPIVGATRLLLLQTNITPKQNQKNAF